MKEALLDAGWKVEGARLHLKNLDRGLAMYSAACGDTIGVEYDAEEGCHLVFPILHEEEVLPRPRQLALIVGDLIHNARSALNYVAWQLAIKKLGRDPTEKEARQIQFPITPDANSFASSPVLGFIDLEAAQEIERCQPYPPHTSGNPAEDPLAILHHLSNEDKHRLIVTTIARVSLEGLNYVADPPAPIRVESTAGRDLEDNMLGNPLRLCIARVFLDGGDASNTRVYVDPQPPTEIRFYGTVEWLSRAKLEEIVDRVAEIVDRFDRFF